MHVMPLYELQMIGTAVFAVTGVLAVNRRGLDVFGAVVLGMVTSLGGGTIRDLVIGAPVFWLSDGNYVWIAVAASLAGFICDHLQYSRRRDPLAHRNAFVADQPERHAAARR
jgi:uncharacterized membrane protein YeiH